MHFSAVWMPLSPNAWSESLRSWGTVPRCPWMQLHPCLRMLATTAVLFVLGRCKVKPGQIPLRYPSHRPGFWATVCKTVRRMLSDRCLSVSPVLTVMSVCDVRALWPNDWTDQDETWHAGRPRPWPHYVRWGPSSASPKGAQSPNLWLISVAAKWLHGSRCQLVWS